MGSFFFKIHTGTLRLQTWLQENRFDGMWGTDCTICKKPESIEMYDEYMYLFIHCLMVVPLSFSSFSFSLYLSHSLSLSLVCVTRGTMLRAFESRNASKLDESDQYI